MDIQRLGGRTIIVTGATSGIGYFTAEGLAALGASVIVAARSARKAETAVALLPGPGQHRHLPFDLSDLASIRTAGVQVADGIPIDGLVMNAGLVTPAPYYATGLFEVEATVDVNVMAHMEFLRLAMPALQRAPAGRIVSTGSMLTRKIPFSPENWLSQKSYRPRTAYAMSKHAAEILGFELARRLRSDASTVTSVVTHPGGAIDALTPDRPPLHQRSVPIRALASALAPLTSRLVQGKDAAARSTIAAIAAPEVVSGSYIGPAQVATGSPSLSTPVATSQDAELGAWLWERTERIIGTRMRISG